MMHVLWLAGCRDEQLAPLADAAAAYDLGKKHFEQGQFPESVTDFGRARGLDTDSPVLALWQARALASEGKFAEAEAVTTEVVEAHPNAGLAWYNRAAYRARQGHHAAASEDLRRAFSLGTTSALRAAADPDFQSVLGRPEYAGLLPASAVVAVVKGPPGSVFVGSDVEIELSVSSAPGLHFAVRRDGLDPGCLSLRSIVEERVLSPDTEVRTLHIRSRAVARCATSLGPFVVDATGPVATSVASESVPLVVEAPAAFFAPAIPPFPTRIFVPFEHAPVGDAWSVGRDDAVVFALGRADVHPTAAGAPPEVLVELREDAGTRAAGGYWNSGPIEVVAGEFREAVP